MSLAAMACAWDLDVPAVQKIVLLRIADGCGDEGGAFCLTLSATARACGLSDAALKDCIESLQKDGLLVIGTVTSGDDWSVVVHGQLMLKSAALSAQKIIWPE